MRLFELTQLWPDSPEDPSSILTNGDAGQIQLLACHARRHSTVYKATDRAPVMGMPVLIQENGSINIPSLDPIPVAGLTTQQIVEQIQGELGKLTRAGVAVNVSYLAFAGEHPEIRNWSEFQSPMRSAYGQASGVRD